MRSQARAARSGAFAVRAGRGADDAPAHHSQAETWRSGSGCGPSALSSKTVFQAQECRETQKQEERS